MSEKGIFTSENKTTEQIIPYDRLMEITKRATELFFTYGDPLYLTKEEATIILGHGYDCVPREVDEKIDTIIEGNGWQIVGREIDPETNNIIIQPKAKKIHYKMKVSVASLYDLSSEIRNRDDCLKTALACQIYNSTQIIDDEWRKEVIEAVDNLHKISIALNELRVSTDKEE